MKSYSGRKDNLHLTQYAGEKLDVWPVTDSTKNKGYNGLHKQFTIGRAAVSVEHAWRPLDTNKSRLARVKVSPDLEWRWQYFKARKKGPTSVGTALDVLSTKAKSILRVFRLTVPTQAAGKAVIDTNLGATTNEITPKVTATKYLKVANMEPDEDTLLTALAAEEAEEE